MAFHQQPFFSSIILDLDPAIDSNSELQITGKKDANSYLKSKSWYMLYKKQYNFHDFSYFVTVF